MYTYYASTVGGGAMGAVIRPDDADAAPPAPPAPSANQNQPQRL